MENSEETKTVDEAEKPAKPTLMNRLKGQRWTFKVKNNLTQYVTVEPLICFYMFQIFVLSLIEPYHFHKACLSLDVDTYFCDVITINEHEFNQACADYKYRNIYCKGFSKDNETIHCKKITRRYDNNETEAFVKPENYRFCHVVGNTTDRAYTTTDSLVGLSAIITNFLVVMVVSIWSDKYSKRKICLMLPILGQLIISIRLILMNLVLNILCLFYVKVILNESKEKVIISGSEEGSGSASISSETRSVISSGKGGRARKTKRKQLAKAFNLDVIWDYILIVFKKRVQNGRLIIILFLTIVFVGKISPFDERFTLTSEWFSFDIIDVDGAIFVIISIMMLLIRVSDVTIAILVIGLPTAARLIMIFSGEFFRFSRLKVAPSATDFYTPFKQIASCSLLLAFVDKNETRIFLIVQAIAYLPKAVFQFITSKLNANMIDIFELLEEYDYKLTLNILAPFAIFGLPVLLFCGLVLLYKIVKNYEKFKTEQMSTKKTVEDIVENPWSFIKPANFEIKNDTDKDQLTPADFTENEHSTDL